MIGPVAPTPSANHARHRAACHLHLSQRANQWRIPLTVAGVARLAAAIGKLRPAFETPGKTRYWIIARTQGRLVRVLYDTGLDCLVAVFPGRGRGGGR